MFFRSYLDLNDKNLIFDKALVEISTELLCRPKI